MSRLNSKSDGMIKYKNINTFNVSQSDIMIKNYPVLLNERFGIIIINQALI